MWLVFAGQGFVPQTWVLPGSGFFGLMTGMRDGRLEHLWQVTSSVFGQTFVRASTAQRPLGCVILHGPWNFGDIIRRASHAGPCRKGQPTGHRQEASLVARLAAGN